MSIDYKEILKETFGEILEKSYSATGDIDLSNKSKAIKTLGVKVMLIKGISQDLGEDVAVTFLQENDSKLGIIAQQVVDAVNGNPNSAVTAILGILMVS